MMRLVAVRDSKTEVFGSIVGVRTVAQAERMFGDLVADSSTEMGKHPEDFELWHVGIFDETIGQICETNSYKIACGGDLKHV